MGKNICKNVLIAFVAVLISVLFFSAFAAAAAASKESQLFDKGYKYVLSHQPAKAVETFNLFLKEFPKSASRDAAMYWLAKSLVQVKSFGEAKKVFSDIAKQFPESPFVPHIEKELQALEPQTGADRTNTNADVKILAENAIKAINELQIRLADAEKKAGASEAPLAKALVENEKLQAQLNDEKKKLSASESEAKNLTDNAAKTITELQLKLADAEKRASASGAALSQSTTENEKLQAQLAEEKKKLDAREADVKNLAENAVKAISELQLKLSATAQKSSASGGARLSQ